MELHWIWQEIQQQQEAWRPQTDRAVRRQPASDPVDCSFIVWPLQKLEIAWRLQAAGEPRDQQLVFLTVFEHQHRDRIQVDSAEWRCYFPAIPDQHVPRQSEKDWARNPLENSAGGTVRNELWMETFFQPAGRLKAMHKQQWIR